MKNKVKLSNKKSTDTLSEETKTKPQGTKEYTLNEHMDISSYSHPMNVCREEKWFLAVPSFEATKYFSHINDQNRSSI